MISQDRAHVVSISWGNCEQAQGTAAITAENTLFEEAAAQGQSVVAATGDQGSEDCTGSNGLAVDDPGAQPFVTAVGGTSLEAVGPPPTETVWNRGGAPTGPLVAQGGAGGGGVSNAWQMPGYQANASRSLNVIGPYSSGSACGNSGGRCRQVPDVAADADPARGYEFFWNGNWQAVGGTSAAAPVWAAMLVDADSTPACRGSAIGFANPVLYHAAGTAYGSYLNDVTTGNNDFTASNNGLYPAGPGYDMASGLGSPKAGALAAALCAGSLRVNSPGRQLSTVGQAVSLRVTTSALPGARLQFYGSQLPPGLKISKSTGRITGRPKRIGTWLTGVAALDQNLSLRAAFFHWHVAGAPTVSGITLSGVAAGSPRLTFTLTAGRSAAWLRVISIRLSNGLRFVRPAGRVRVKVIRTKRVAFFPKRIGGRLRIAFAKPVWQIRVTVEPGAIRDSAALAADVRGHHSTRVTVAVMTIDGSGHGVAVRARARPQS
jgi:kumamolisin